MTLGIRNPFVQEAPKPKKPDMRSAYDAIDTEPTSVAPPIVHLDGGRYCINVEGVENAKDAAKTLLDLIYDYTPKEAQRLAQFGVKKIPDDVHIPEQGCIILRIEDKSVSIQVDECRTQEGAFRRMGYALRNVGNKKMLDRHRVSVIERFQ